jgi:DNA-binding GntR family transcriptional regulator
MRQEKAGESVEVGQAEALWQRVIAVLRRAIVLGELAPNVHLKEPLLAQRFGVSRLPVREALVQLEREGLVRVEPRRGAFVLGVTAQDISDIYECRLLLETCGIERAAASAGAQDVACLLAHVDQIEATAGAAEMMAAADMAFHRELIVLSGSRALLNAWEPLAPLIETILSISNAAYADLSRIIEGHRDITRAIERHDVVEAVKLLQAHLSFGERVVHEAVDAVSGVSDGREPPGHNGL